MAESSQALNACNAVIEVDDGTGTPVDVSGEANSASLEFTTQTSEYFTFGGGFARRLQCKEDASLELTLLWTRGGTEARALFEAWLKAKGTRTVSVYPEGNANNGDRQYTGEFVLESYNFDMDATAADPMTITASLMPDGEVTLSTVTT